MKGVLHILTGPTAVGKSALALAWAQAHGAEILSCDALQVYRGMDVGTAKPTRAERAAVVHHGLDLCDPEAPFSVKAFARYALDTAREVLARGKPLLITGGSGFYLKSFYANPADEVCVPAEIIAQVRAWESQGGAALLESELRRRNPDGLGDLDVRNPRRLASALGRCMASGKTLARMRAEFAALPCPFDAFARKTVLLERSPDVLKRRVKERVDSMMAAGLLDEARRLAPQLRKNPAAASAIGYREPLAWLALENPPPLERLADEIARDTCALLRKQRTWFRHQIKPDRVVNLDAEPPPAEALFDF